MVIYLIRDDRRIEVPTPDCAETLPVPGETCECGAPLVVGGTGATPSADDRALECDAVCLACRKRVGTVCVEVPTIFGVREDARVLAGRWRVY